MEKINHLFRRLDQVRHERVEQEKRKAEGERLAAIEERYLKRVLGDAAVTGIKQGRRILRVLPTPHPSDAGAVGSQTKPIAGWRPRLNLTRSLRRRSMCPPPAPMRQREVFA